MNNTLSGIAQQLIDSAQEQTIREQVAERLVTKKVQLIYAFNGSGKTRLSRAFKELVAPKQAEVDGSEDLDDYPTTRTKILYYNAFTEDLFYWNNDLEEDVERKLIIQPNTYTQWVLGVQGRDQTAIGHFQRYTDEKLTPRFNSNFSEVTFSFERGNKEREDNIKISKGEESNFIWSIFYALLEQVIDVLNVAEPSDRETDQFNDLEYIFIDDPVSSLDDNHVIQLAVDLASTIKSNESDLKFIISTHNPLFYNVLCNELGRDSKRTMRQGSEVVNVKWKQKWLDKFRLEKLEDGNHELAPQPNDSPFSYHLHLLALLDKVAASGQIEKYHFNLLRNVLEKTATFLGYNNWEALLPESDDGGPNPYAKRIINFSSHSKHSGEESKFLEPEEKKVLDYVIKHLVSTYGFRREVIEHA